MSKGGKRPHGTAGPLLHVPVVFVHGLKCSYLLDERTGKYAWVTPQMLVRNKRFGDLSLPTTRDQHGSQHTDNLRPHKVIRQIKIGPGTFPVYGPCLEELERQGRQVHAFSYDWRRDLFESTDKLLEFVEKVSKDNGGAKVQVVAHSMGGLVALAAVNKRHDLFHSCLFGGSPFQPCAPMFIGYIVNGRPAGLNKKLLTGRVHFTWSSAYGVLPINGTGIVDSDGTELTFDFFDVDTWVTERWGLFHPDHPQTLVGQPDFEEYREFLREALAQGKAFQQFIQRKHDIPYPPMAVIAGTGSVTRTRLMKDGPQSVCGLDELTPPVSHLGDDLIQVPDTHLPAGIPHYHYTVRRPHAVVLNDMRALNHALQQLDPSTRVHEPAHYYPHAPHAFHPHVQSATSRHKLATAPQRKAGKRAAHHHHQPADSNHPGQQIETDTDLGTPTDGSFSELDHSVQVSPNPKRTSLSQMLKRKLSTASLSSLMISKPRSPSTDLQDAGLARNHSTGGPG